MQNSTTNNKTPLVGTEHINHPSHYGGDSTYEAVNVIEAWGLGWHLGDAVAYIARAGKKPDNSELQDLKKARWCIDRRIAQLEKPNNDVPVATSPEKQLLTWQQIRPIMISTGKRVSNIEWAANSFMEYKNGRLVDESGDLLLLHVFAETSQSFYIINP